MSVVNSKGMEISTERIFAYIVDLVIIFVTNSILSIFIGVVFTILASITMFIPILSGIISLIAIVVSLAVYIIVPILYFYITESKYKHTIGHKLSGLKVEGIESASRNAKIKRAILKHPILMFFVFLIGILNGGKFYHETLTGIRTVKA